MRINKESSLHSEQSSNTFDLMIDNKDKLNKSDYQLSRIRKLLKEKPYSMRELSVLLDEERSNICWYMRDLRKRNEVQVHHKGTCSTTKQLVNYYTCDTNLFKTDSQQLNLFD